MIKNTQTIRQQQPMNCLSVFDHFVGLAVKGLNSIFLKTGKFRHINLFWITNSRIYRENYLNQFVKYSSKSTKCYGTYPEQWYKNAGREVILICY